VNAAKALTEKDFLDAVDAASLLGTLQAAYTDTGYLDRDSEVKVSKKIIEREALLGVSLCGILDNPGICLDAATLQKGAARAVFRNEEIAERIGIRPTSRATCVKPEGTNSLALGGIGSGIHARRARKFIRRIQANELDSVFKTFRSVNPTCVQKMEGPQYGNDSYVVCFPMESPEDAVVQTELDPIDHLRYVKLVQENWVVPGTRKGRLEGGCHSVSVTVTVDSDKWGAVRDFIWVNKKSFVGLSFLPSFGDYIYEYAPQQAVKDPASNPGLSDKEIEAWVFWNQIKSDMKFVDYTATLEFDDATDLIGEQACSSGKCELV